MEKELTIGFIGQGFIGKNYADDFVRRGYNVARYSLEEEYVGNKEKIKDCDIVFIAVPAPTLPSGELRDDGYPKVKFNDSIVREAIGLVRDQATVVIKSTLPPGTTELLQEENLDKIILFSPEFLTESTAAHDAANPGRNIIGVPKEIKEHKEAAELIMKILPEAPYKLITSSKNAELIKYANNAFLFVKIVFVNIFYELAEKNGADWEIIHDAVGHDPRVGPSHMDLHLKNDPENVMRRRGAGRSCFIKDFAELSEIYAKALPDDVNAIKVLRGFEYKNAELLREFDRYINLLEGVYGKDAGNKIASSAIRRGGGNN